MILTFFLENKRKKQPLIELNVNRLGTDKNKQLDLQWTRKYTHVNMIPQGGHFLMKFSEIYYCIWNLNINLNSGWYDTMNFRALYDKGGYIYCFTFTWYISCDIFIKFFPYYRKRRKLPQISYTSDLKLYKYMHTFQGLSHHLMDINYGGL